MFFYSRLKVIRLLTSATCESGFYICRSPFAEHEIQLPALPLTGIRRRCNLLYYFTGNPAQARMSWASRRILSWAITGYTQISRMEASRDVF